MNRLLLLTLLSISLSGCSMFKKKSQPPKDAPAASEAKETGPDSAQNVSDAAMMGSPAGSVEPSGPSDRAPIEKNPSERKSTPEVNTPTAGQKALATPSGKAHAHADEGVAPEKALGWLKNGNKRFTSARWRKDGASKADIKRLSTGQKPHTVVLSCSDSRVPPEIVFDQKLGEIFVVRTAGEVVEPASLGSIEYAISHLGARLILVMGHNRCGAVRAALETMVNKETGSENINKLVALIHPHFGKIAGKAVSKDLSQESWANAEGVAGDLLTKSKMIRDRVKAGEVKIHTALYNLDSGNVDFASN